jgi:hypothetical protein
MVNIYKGGKLMIRTESISPLLTIDTTDTGREIDPISDPEVVRLAALNLELAVRNLVQSRQPPECLVITAELCNHRIMATPTVDGDIKIIVYDK